MRNIYLRNIYKREDTGYPNILQNADRFSRRFVYGRNAWDGEGEADEQ